MKGKILVTDSLFIFDEHVKQIENAGYQVERLDKPEPSEEELCGAIKAKVGYILGGIEKVTEKVIDAADSLKVIAFTGIGLGFIPASAHATKKGIAIVDTPDGPAHAVAEWAVGAAIAMNRNFFELGRTGKTMFKTTPGIENQHIGLIGYGHIGTEIGEIIKVFRPASISYYSRRRHEDTEAKTGVKYKPKEKILEDSDIVFLCVSHEAGKDFIAAPELSKMKKGSLLVSILHPDVINEQDLFSELKSGRLRAISDYPAKSEEFDNLPLGSWFCLNGSNAYNTTSETKLVSDMAVKSLLNILSTGEDKNLINPEYKKFV